jgi:hypothetical protein
LDGDIVTRISFVSDDSYWGEGVSIGIPRGLMVQIDGINITQESLGLGAIALIKDGLTYFPSDCHTESDGSAITKKFPIGSALVFDSPFMPLSSMMPFYRVVSKVYMVLPTWQNRLLDLRGWFFSKFKVRPVLRKNEPLAIAEITYHPRADAVEVKCSIRSLKGPLPEICVMNEVGADHFDASIQAGAIGKAPSGWCELPMRLPSPALWDAKTRTAFFIDRIECDEGMDVSLFWGREKAKDLCWAGLELKLRNLEGLSKVELGYEIRFETVGP